MFLHERVPATDRESREKIYYKTLRLITPDVAQKLGIPAEAPVFISPHVIPGTCSLCGRSYNPLVYQTGRVVDAHHFHKDELGSGGIFWNIADSPPGFIGAGWLAILSSVGKIVENPNASGRSEAVIVKRIIAFCNVIPHEGEISEGLLHSFTTGRFLSLSPLCSLEEHPERSSGLSSWRFRIINGEVFFTRT